MSNATIWTGPTDTRFVISPNTSVVRETQVSAQGQNSFTLQTFTYTPGSNTLWLWINGVFQNPVVDYIEVSTSVITTSAELNLGDILCFVGFGIGNVSISNPNFLQEGLDAVNRTVQNKLQEEFSIQDFGVKPGLLTDQYLGLQAAINAISLVNGGAGGRLILPRGIYKFGTTLTMKKNVTLWGEGDYATQLIYTGVADAIRMTSPINSSTAVRTRVIGLGVTMDNPAATGGCYVDVGGTFAVVEDVAFTGGKFGLVLDQSELVSIKRADIEAQIPGGGAIWLCNGPDHTPGAASGFTNRILIEGCQLNNGGSAYSHIIDDGGVSHSYKDNNINSGITTGLPPAARFAGVLGLTWESNYAEGGQHVMYFASTTNYGGIGAGACISVSITGHNIFSMSQANAPIKLVSSVGPTKLDGAWFGGNSASKIEGAANFTSLDVGENFWNTGALLDAYPAIFRQLDNTGHKGTGYLSVGGKIGYTTGAGGAVLQLVSKATAVVSNTYSTEITTNNSNLNAGATVFFTFTNDKIGINDIPKLIKKSGGTLGAYDYWVESVAIGSCVIAIKNTTAGILGEALVLQINVDAGSVN